MMERSGHVVKGFVPPGTGVNAVKAPKDVKEAIAKALRQNKPGVWLTAPKKGFIRKTRVSFKRPKRIGSLWQSPKGSYIHGPRQKSPKSFQSMYTVQQSFARQRGLKIPRGIPKSSRVKVGVLRKSRKLGVQSFLTPKRAYAYTRRYPRRSRTGMYRIIRSHIKRRRRR